MQSKNSLMTNKKCLVKDVPMCVEGPNFLQFLLLSSIKIKRLPALLTKTSQFINNKINSGICALVLQVLSNICHDDCKEVFLSNIFCT